ncbi:Ig-like domain-containing protein [Streptosporangium soli]
MHLWRFELSADLAEGAHSAMVTATDSHGRRFTDVLQFRVAERR